MPNALSGKDRLIVNTWFTQILLIINRSQLPFTLSRLSAKGQLYVAQMGILLIPSNSILLSDTILIMATNSPSEKFGWRFGFAGIAVSYYEWKYDKQWFTIVCNTFSDWLFHVVSRHLLATTCPSYNNTYNPPTMNLYILDDQDLQHCWHIVAFML